MHALVCFLSTVVEFKGISFWVAFRVAALPGDLGWQGRTSVPFRNGIPFWNLCVPAEKSLLYGRLPQDCVEKPCSSVERRPI